jgi:hypothetical protein
MWGFGMQFQLKFETPSRIHRRTKAALDELVERKVITVEQFNDFGGLVYKGTGEAYDIGQKLSQAAIKRLLDGTEGGSFPVCVENGDHPDAWGDKSLDQERNARMRDGRRKKSKAR